MRGGGSGTGNLRLHVRIKEAISNHIVAGTLPIGQRLPTIRDLAEMIDVNPMTVAKAYKALAEIGYVQARGSGGTFVTQPKLASTDEAEWMQKSTGPAVLSEQLFSLARAPGVIGFTTNYPDPALADIVGFKSCLAEIAADTSLRWFRYDPAAGRDELRGELVGFVARRGIVAKLEDILVTSGGQQALDIVVRALVAPGDVVIVERPTYFGGLSVLRAARARIVEIPLQTDGPDLAALEAAMKAHSPRLLYLNPTFQNPSGVTTSLTKRLKILDLARETGCAILEDDHCPELRFAGEPVPSFKALADPNELIYYASGFGKSLIPGIRLGFLLPPRNGGDAIAAIKATTDLQSNAVLQGALALYLRRGQYVAHQREMTAVYRSRQRVLLESLKKFLPDTVVAVVPNGGLSVWLTLPESCDLSNIYFLAAHTGVAFASGESFFARAARANNVRLSFGLTSDEQIVEGIQRLAAVVRDMTVR